MHLRIVARIDAFYFKVRGFFVDVGINTKRINERIFARFQINRLPDAAGGRVPMPLFSDGLLAIIHRIFHAQNHERFGAAIGLSFERVR